MKTYQRGGIGILLLMVIVIPIIVWAMTWLCFMKTEAVEPGQELVFVDKPYFFGHEGVRDAPLKAGRELMFLTTSVYPVTVVPQSIQVNFDDLSSSDNILLDFGSTIQYRVTDSVNMVKNFGKHWFAHNISNQYSAIVRKAVKQKSMTEMMSNVSAADEVDTRITEELRMLVALQKLPVEILNVTLGRAKPNKNVLTQMNETAAQQQRKKTIIESNLAEIERATEQANKAKADNAYRNEMHIDVTQFVELEKAKLYAAACAKSGNCIVTSDQAGIVLPVK